MVVLNLEVLLALLKKKFDFQNPSNMGVGLAHKLGEPNQLEKQEHFLEANDAEYPMLWMGYPYPIQTNEPWRPLQLRGMIPS
ncbi:urotensin-2B-like [Thomomys bottae]